MTDLTDLIARVENGEGADRGLLHEAWNVLAQIDPGFRRFACSIIDDAGTTQAGRFAALVEAGASLDAAMALVPDDLYIVCIGEFKDGFEKDGKQWFAKLCQRSPHKPLPPAGAPNAARALLAAILRAKEAGQ